MRQHQAQHREETPRAEGTKAEADAAAEETEAAVEADAHNQLRSASRETNSKATRRR